MQLPFLQPTAILLPASEANSGLAAKVDPQGVEHFQRTEFSFSKSGFEAIVEGLAQDSQNSAKQLRTVSVENGTIDKALHWAKATDADLNSSETEVGLFVDDDATLVLPQAAALPLQSVATSFSTSGGPNKLEVIVPKQQSPLPASLDSQFEGSQRHSPIATPAKLQQVITASSDLAPFMQLGNLGSASSSPAQAASLVQSANHSDPYGSPVKPIGLVGQFSGSQRDQLTLPSATNPVGVGSPGADRTYSHASEQPGSMQDLESPHHCGVVCHKPPLGAENQESVPIQNSHQENNRAGLAESPLVPTQAKSVSTGSPPQQFGNQTEVTRALKGQGAGQGETKAQSVMPYLTQKLSGRPAASSQPEVHSSPMGIASNELSAWGGSPLRAQTQAASIAQNSTVAHSIGETLNVQNTNKGENATSLNHNSEPATLPIPMSMAKAQMDPAGAEQGTRSIQPQREFPASTEPASTELAGVEQKRASLAGIELSRSIQTNKYRQNQNENGIANLGFTQDADEASQADPPRVLRDQSVDQTQAQSDLSASFASTNSTQQTKSEIGLASSPIPAEFNSTNLTTPTDSNIQNLNSDQSIHASVSSPTQVNSANLVQRFDSLGDQTLAKFVNTIVEDRAQLPVQEKNITRVQIAIVPPDLGEVRIEITKDSVRTVATVTVANEYALYQMQSNIQSLQSSLESLGVEFQDVELEDGKADTDRQEDTGAQARNQHLRERESNSLEPIDRDRTEQSELKLKSAHVVDILL